jgi:AraC family transcriptional regulator
MIIQLGAGGYFGQTQRRREVDGLIFAECVYGTALHLPRHQHLNAFLHLIVEGMCKEVYEDQTRLALPMCLAFHPAGEVHANHWQSDGGRVFHVEITASKLASLQTYTALPDHLVHLQHGRPTWLARRLFGEYRLADDTSSLAMEGLALEILAEVSRLRVQASERTPPRWLLRVRELLHDRFSENLCLTTVASAVDIHPVHLARVFRRWYGCTVGDYIRNLRVDFAIREIARNRPLAEVALAAGFSDQSHFTKIFKRFSGMTPTKFQKEHSSR